MKKKALLSILLAALLTLSACSKNKKDDSSSNTSSEKQESSSTSDLFPNSSDIEESSPSSNVSSEKPVDVKPIIINNVDLTKAQSLENKRKGWGQGYNVNKLNRPLSCDEYQNKYGNYDALFIMPETDKKMYLTFDEGYENGYTSKILDTLKEKKCSAVFFVTMPYVKEQPALIKRMIDEGHVVGNHSVKHKSTPSLTIEEQVNEIVTLHNYMVDNFNYKMTLFRPPMGEWSTQTLYVTQALGYKTVFWSYAYKDYDTKNQIGVEAAFPKVSKAAHNGAIYLLHAVSKDNTEMLGSLIDNFRENGYSLEKLQ